MYEQNITKSIKTGRVYVQEIDSLGRQRKRNVGGKGNRGLRPGALNGRID